MSIKKIFIFSLIFFLVGEFLVRFDQRFDLLGRNAEAIILVEMMETQLRDSVEQGSFPIDTNQLRVLVLGDSYIYGSFIDPEKKFSNELQKELDNNSLNNKKVVVLDVSKPNNNTSDNFDFLKYYNELFKPHVVFWAYHYNDIQDLRPIKETMNQEEITERDKATVRKRVGWKYMVKKIYNISQLIRFLSSSLQRELKMQGIVLPMGDFYALTQQTYHEKNKDWMLTKDIFEETIHLCHQENIELIVYKLPIFNLLSKNELFAKVDRTLSGFFEGHKEIHYLYGYNNFNDVKDTSKYRVSKYDGHPNKNAHSKMASSVAQEILKIQEANK